MLSPSPVFARAGPASIHLRLIATTDLHAHVLPYDYFADRVSGSVGLALAASRIAEARAGAANALVLDNGDFLQGNPLADYMAHERGLTSGQPHPMLRAMAQAGIEIATLGNHEFNYGLDFLSSALADAPFPVVSANTATTLGATPLDDAPFVAPWRVLDREVVDASGSRKRLRIGVIGFCPPQILLWDHHNLKGRLAARDIIETAKARVPELRAAGADVVVALAHSGIGPAAAEPGMENAATALGAIAGIDAIVCGHTHGRFPAPDFAARAGCDPVRGLLNGTPAVMPGFVGSDVGIIDLLLDPAGPGWRVAASQVALLPIGAPGLRPDPQVMAAAEPEHSETLDYIRRPAGRLTVPLHSYFALVADDPCSAVVAEAKRDYVAEVLADTPFETLPLLSAAGPFKAGGRGGPDYFTDIPAGDVALKNVADLYLYPNTVCAIRLTGAELAEYIERAAAIYRQIAPGAQDAQLLDPEFPSYNYDVVHGVHYAIDLSAPPRYDRLGRLVAPESRRIRDLTYAGRPVAPEAEFLMATNNYRAGGGGEYPGTGPDRIVLAGADTARDVLLNHFQASGTLDPQPGETWRFVPMPGTTVVFDTGPGARAYLPDPRLAVEEIGPAPGGFLRMRLRL